jgi:hypothetical protein
VHGVIVSAVVPYEPRAAAKASGDREGFTVTRITDPWKKPCNVRAETLELSMDTQIDAINDEDLDFVSGGDYHSSTKEIQCPIGSLMVYDSGCCVPVTVDYKPPK